MNAPHALSGWRVVAAAFTLLAACSTGTPPQSADAAADAAADTDARVDVDAGLATEHSVLFVGNSYVYVNDVPGRYRAMVKSLPFGSVRVEEVTTGGYRLNQHAADANTVGTLLYRALHPESTEPAPSFVVLQEQSQIGGFAAHVEQRVLSTEAASSLAALARARGARVVLYLTWGRRDGDPANAGYETFESMQALLDVGYRDMAERIHAEGADVSIAPVGPAFREVLESDRASGRDPWAEGSDFVALYEPDGSHPSARGAYLAACVIAATTTSADPSTFPDDAALGGVVSGSLRDACGRAASDPRWAPPDSVRAHSTFELTAADDVETYVALNAAGDRGLLATLRNDFEGGAVMSASDARGLTREGDTWRLDAPVEGDEPLSFFPRSAVAIDASGDHALIASAALRDREGTGFFFSRAGATWTEDARLEAVEPIGTLGFGEPAVAMSGDGGWALTGAPFSAQGGVQSGAVRVFASPSSVWTMQTILSAPDPSDGDLFGVSVALGGDGSVAVVGAARAGVGYVFVREGAEGVERWRHDATLQPADPLEGGRDAPVVLSSDASVAALGAPDAGLVHVFVRSAMGWSQEATLGPYRSGDGFGRAIALSADGTTLLVAAPSTSNAFGIAGGEVRAYRRGPEGWSERARLLPSGGNEGRFLAFGRSLATSGDGRWAIVGASSPYVRIYQLP